MGKAASPTGVVIEMMKASGGFGTRWMTDRINIIVKVGCTPDDDEKRIRCLVSIDNMQLGLMPGKGTTDTTSTRETPSKEEDDVLYFCGF